MALQLRRRACLSEVVGISWCNLLPIADKEVILDGWVYYCRATRRVGTRAGRRARVGAVRSLDLLMSCKFSETERLQTTQLLTS